jgi:hypothetical protein
MKTKKFTFIESTLSAEQAQEMLMEVYAAKITFHQMRNFSHIERFGKTDRTALRRINALKKDMATLKKTITTAAQKNKLISITSDIQITII